MGGMHVCVFVMLMWSCVKCICVYMYVCVCVLNGSVVNGWLPVSFSCQCCLRPCVWFLCSVTVDFMSTHDILCDCHPAILSPSLCLSVSLSLSFCLSLCLSVSVCLSVSLSLSLPFCHSLSLSCSHSPVLSFSLSLSVSLRPGVGLLSPRSRCTASHGERRSLTSG